MKNSVYLLLLFFAAQAGAQTTGGTINPTTKFQGYNKSLLATGQRSLDGKYKYTDTAHFIERSFRSVAEANLYIPTNQRTVGLSVNINKLGTQNPSSGVITGGLNEDYQYKNGILDADLVLKVSVNGVFEPKENGNVYFPAYVSAALLGTTSGGLLNPLTQIPAGVTVITQAPGTSNGLPASTAFVMAALGAATDTTRITTVGGGIAIIKTVVNTYPKEWTFRSFVNGTNTTVRLVGTDGIAIDVASVGGIDAAASTNFTGINTFTNAAKPVAITRTASGSVLSLTGPVGTLNLGNSAFGSTFDATGRLDIRTATGTDLFLGADHVMVESVLNLTRVGTVGAISVATQKNSRDLVFENALYNGTNYFSYNGIQSRASTTQAGVSSLVFRLGSVGNPDLNTGFDALEITTTGSYIFNMFAHGGPDSVLTMTGTGLLKKVALSLGGGDVYQNGANAMTGLNTFTNAGTAITMRRTTMGAALQVEGPLGTNFMTFGTHATFGHNQIYSNGRLDIAAPGAYIFLVADAAFATSNFALTRKTGATTSTATQLYSYDQVFENELWNGTTSYKSYNGWQSRASTTVQGLSSMVMRLGSLTNPDLVTGKDALEIRTDSVYKLNLMNKGGTLDSTTRLMPDGTLKKYTTAHPATGVMTAGGILQGAGTGATITVVGNDLEGTVTLTCGSTGDFTTNFSFNYLFATTWPGTTMPIAVLSPMTATAAGLQAYSLAINNQIIVSSINHPVASSIYTFAYHVRPPVQP